MEVLQNNSPQKYNVNMEYTYCEIDEILVYPPQIYWIVKVP